MDSASCAPHFYAVRRGRVPGIYNSWADCKKNTNGYKGALYKKFYNMNDAKVFMASSSKSRNKKIRDDEKKAHEMYGKLPRNTAAHMTAPCPTKPASSSSSSSYMPPPKKRKRRTGISLQITHAMSPFSPVSPPRPPSYASITAGKTSTYILPPSSSVARIHIKPVFGEDYYVPDKGHVYIDGSTLDNSSEFPKAGVGVFFGPRCSRNVSKRLTGKNQTSGRAELMAAVYALDVTAGYTVSYSIFKSRKSSNSVSSKSSNPSSS
jgi:ribonuclease HI